MTKSKHNNQKPLAQQLDELNTNIDIINELDPNMDIFEKRSPPPSPVGMHELYEYLDREQSSSNITVAEQNVAEINLKLAEMLTKDEPEISACTASIKQLEHSLEIADEEDKEFIEAAIDEKKNHLSEIFSRQEQMRMMQQIAMETLQSAKKEQNESEQQLNNAFNQVEIKSAAPAITVLETLIAQKEFNLESLEKEYTALQNKTFSMQQNIKEKITSIKDEKIALEDDKNNLATKKSLYEGTKSNLSKELTVINDKKEERGRNNPIWDNIVTFSHFIYRSLGGQTTEDKIKRDKGIVENEISKLENESNKLQIKINNIDTVLKETQSYEPIPLEDKIKIKYIPRNGSFSESPPSEPTTQAAKEIKKLFDDYCSVKQVVAQQKEKIETSKEEIRTLETEVSELEKSSKIYAPSRALESFKNLIDQGRPPIKSSTKTETPQYSDNNRLVI